MNNKSCIGGVANPGLDNMSHNNGNQHNVLNIFENISTDN